jgi:hypothetical protein
MFCQTCGAEFSYELNYCNRCGSNLNPTALAARTEMVPVSTAKPMVAIGIIMAAITLGGFGILIAGAIQLAGVLHQTDPALAVIMFGMIVILVTDIMLGRMLSRLLSASLQTGQPARFKPAVKEFPKQINPRPEPIGSITEHTTRTFDPVYRTPAEKVPIERETR